MIKSIIDINNIKKIKKMLKKNGLNINFNIIILTIKTLLMFITSNKDRLSVGLVVGLNNKNRFNNFSAIPMLINRPKELVSIEKMDQDTFTNIFINLLKEINKKSIENKFMIHMFYSLTNIFNTLQKSCKVYF